MDHSILAAKILELRVPRGIARWVCDFLMDRRQRVKLSNDCFSEWGAVPSGVPQGTKLGPWLFVLMINDLRPSGSDAWKYVDDTTVAEVVPMGGQSAMQETLSAVEDWSNTNKLQLKVAYYRFIKVKGVYSINVQIYYYFCINILITNTNPYMRPLLLQITVWKVKGTRKMEIYIRFLTFSLTVKKLPYGFFFTL